MPRPIILTQTALARVASLVEQGRTAAEIATEMGCTLGTLRVRCSQFGISLRRGATSREETVTAMDLVPSTETNAATQRKSVDRRSSAELPTALKGPAHCDRGRAKPTKVYDLDVEGPRRVDSAPGRGEFLVRGTVLTLHLPDVTQQSSRSPRRPQLRPAPERQLLTEPPGLHLPRAPEQGHMTVQTIAPLRLQPGVSSSYYPMAGGRTWRGICQVVVVAIRTMWRVAHSGLPASRYWRRSIPHCVRTSVSKSKL